MSIIEPSQFATPGASPDSEDYVSSTSPASGAQGVAEEHDKDASGILGAEERIVADEALLTVTTWQASHAYTKMQLALSPSGAYTAGTVSLIQCTASHTSGSSFSGTDWLHIADIGGGGGGGGGASDVPQTVTLSSAGPVTVNWNNGNRALIVYDATPSALDFTNMQSGYVYFAAHSQGSGGPYSADPIPTSVNGGAVTVLTQNRLGGPTPITNLSTGLDVWMYWLLPNGTTLVASQLVPNVG